ncbi:hypothetical protein MSAN_01470600 [Mycena sanguinolenta]|uniref:Peroxisome membrane anchor protein Pex14p N-terminal domain-containing protein n=1 Tax=Mycena sanguinolenta TaxID=230812 RepID=A0A8H6YCG8_9AGAR|nr:hypothetical protein MSAN_01470600 [Mycena sanguinolenta]
MTDEKDSGGTTTPSETASTLSDTPTSVTTAESSVSQPPAPENRVELLTKARAFLHQPQIQREDALSKRRFLAEKGLNDLEIENLMRELPAQIPSVPPRSYPQPPPSNLPVLLLGLARVFSWIVGGTAALAFIYYRVLLPRVISTFMARGLLKSHQLSLIQKLNASLAALKQSQNEMAAVLPKPEPHKEPNALAACLSIDALLEQAKKLNIEVSGVSEISLLRCAISDFRKGSESRNPTTEEVFQVLEGKIPWLVSEEGAPFEQRLWDTLSTCPLFASSTSPSPDSPPAPTDRPEILYWGYNPPVPPTPTALAESLSALSASMPKSSRDKHSAIQHALQSITDFTGYISSQMYAPYTPVGSRFGATLNPAEEEVRKEIRALKGLVLNRRTFLPSTPTRPQ